MFDNGMALSSNRSQYEGEEAPRNIFYKGAAPITAIPAVRYLMSKKEPQF